MLADSFCSPLLYKLLFTSFLLKFIHKFCLYVLCTIFLNNFCKHLLFTTFVHNFVQNLVHSFCSQLLFTTFVHNFCSKPFSFVSITLVNYSCVQFFIAFLTTDETTFIHFSSSLFTDLFHRLFSLLLFTAFDHNFYLQLLIINFIYICLKRFVPNCCLQFL